MLNKISRLLRWFGRHCKTAYTQTHAYFTDGTFVVQVYPFLMHPCIRGSYFTVIRILSLLISFCGVFYLLTELISVLFTDEWLGSYTRRTTLELLQPAQFGDNQSQRLHSPLYYTMQGVFAVQSAVFAVAYFFGLSFISDKKLHCLGILSAILFSAGCAFISQSPQGSYTEYGLINLGFSLTFICAGLSLMFAALIFQRRFKYFKWYSLLSGLLICLSVGTACFYPTEYTPLLERGGIYTLMLWEILTGFAIMSPLRESVAESE